MNEAKYRASEQRLWAHCGGLTPREHRVRLPFTGTEVRVQEVGEGAPVLFLHGGPNAGSTWAPLVAHLSGLRCLLVDRPGTGLSDPFAVTPDNLPAVSTALVSEVLDGLGIERAHVVASSFGGHIALRAAGAAPERFDRMVQMAAPAASPSDRLPPFMKWVSKGWVRAILGVLPPSERASRSIFRQIGHGYALDNGLVDPVFFGWYMDMQRYTDTMRHDGNMIGRIIPAVDRVRLTSELLGKVRVPTLFLWGEDDGFGGEETARAVTGPMPDVELVMLPHAGHLPWLDDPSGIAARVQAFLTAGA
jgi:pimeloyl-ACP methyl ester carboxylesterase